MAVQKMSESYYRCIEELKNRYKGRGIFAANSVESSAKRESMADEEYIVFNSNSYIGDSYRSGVYNGAKYMTSSDFVRYYKSRRAFYMPQALRKKQEEIATTNSALPQRKTNGRGNRELTNSDSNSKEGHLKIFISALDNFKQKWFPAEPRQGRINTQKFRFPVAAMSGLAVFTVSLGLIVGGSAMIGKASGEIGKLNSEISVLEAKKTDLEGKLDLKYDISQIEADAQELGMIKSEHADNQHLEIEGDNEIIVYEKGQKEDVTFSTLLSAFGIKID